MIAIGAIAGQVLGSKTFWKGVVIALLAWAIYLGWGFYNEAIAENARLTENLATVSAEFKVQIEEAKKMKAEAERLQKIYVTREEVHQARTVKLEETLRLLKEIEDEDQAAKYYSDIPIPATIYNRVLSRPKDDTRGKELPDPTDRPDAALPQAEP